MNLSTNGIEQAQPNEKTSYNVQITDKTTKAKTVNGLVALWFLRIWRMG